LRSAVSRAVCLLQPPRRRSKSDAPTPHANREATLAHWTVAHLKSHSERLAQYFLKQF
jgi:hypothetical protein